jgi:hypothetical protein
MMLRTLLARLFFVVCFGFDALEHALAEFAVFVVVLVVMAMIPFDVIIIDTDSGV